jgi:hypothetical protein
MCDLRRTEPPQGSVRQIVLGGIPFPSSLPNRARPRYRSRLSVAFTLQSIARWHEVPKNTGWKPMVHWFSRLLSDLPKPSLELSPRAWSDDATALKYHRLPACVLRAHPKAQRGCRWVPSPAFQPSRCLSFQRTATPYSSTALRIPSFSRMFAQWTWTVLMLIPRVSAI